MNYITARIEEIQSVESINIVSFSVEEHRLRMMALELDENLHSGSSRVLLGVKATHIALARELRGVLSISNQLPCIIKSIEWGELLCSVKLSFAGEILESIITKESAEGMKLDIGDEVLALIKSSDLSILEYL